MTRVLALEPPWNVTVRGRQSGRGLIESLLRKDPDYGARGYGKTGEYLSEMPISENRAENRAENQPADERLIEAVLLGFGLLVSRYKKKVFLIVAKYARDADELDDVCQDIFIKIYQGLKKYRGDAPFDHWLSKLAVNACYDLLRKRQRAPDKVPMETLDFSTLIMPDRGEMSGNEAWEILRPALARLSPEDRLVITLLNLEEKSVREIAALTGWSEAKVKVRAFRARKELKRMLEDNNGRRS